MLISMEHTVGFVRYNLCHPVY